MDVNDRMAREAPAPGPSIGFRVVSRTMDAMARLLRWRWITEGIDNIPSSGGAVITWNHHSELDFMATACEVYIRTGRPARILATAELWELAPMRWMLRMVDAIPVERSSGDGRRDALQAAIDALRDGHLVLVAPEGRISPSLELLPFKTGAVRMAQRASVPLVPSAARDGCHQAAASHHRPAARRGAAFLPGRRPCRSEVGPSTSRG